MHRLLAPLAQLARCASRDKSAGSHIVIRPTHVALHVGQANVLQLARRVAPSHPVSRWQVARANAEQGGGAKKTLAGAVQMFRELSHSTVALIAGKSEDADEDPEYLKVLRYS